MQGILVVNKSKGMTSHDVVARVRRIFKTRQVGHTGTLDPDAEGVLPVLIGRATKLSDILTSEEKTYIARVKLGIVTDTYDITGTVKEENAVNVTKEDIKQTADEFLGVQMQIPPMYSAIKIDGKKLYQLAREGIEIERPAREIEINKISCFDFDLKNNSFSLEVCCSKGTYIRSLCHDLGKKLGCGAVMSELLRTKSGTFTIDMAHSLEEISESFEKGEAENLLISIDEALSAYPKVLVSEENAKKIRNGLRLRTNQLGVGDAKEGDSFRFYDSCGLLCLSTVICDDTGTLVLKLEKTFFNC